ncbi:MAG: SgcJ/EcaC family oxidoreductase [Acidobacteriaceae bacterium]
MQRRTMVSAMVVCMLGAVAGVVPAKAQATAADKAAIQALYKHFNDGFNKKDVDAVMTVYAPDVFVFDVVPPRQYVGWDAYKKDWQDVFASMPGPVTNTVVDLDVTVVGSVAYTHYINDGTMTDKDGKQVHMVARSTDVLRKKDGKWLIVEEHNSFPVDMTTGQADMQSKP